LANVKQIFSPETHQGVSGEKICLTLANQKQELLLEAIFVGQTKQNEETL
jgi:hypothetical protein